MVKGKISLKKSGAGFETIRKSLELLAKKEVLVGIPEDEATRENGDIINNAELLYVHTHGIRTSEMRAEMQKNMDNGMKYSKAHSMYIREHGSPLFRVPPRPVLEPAIEDSKEIIAEELKQANISALDRNPAQAEAHLNKAGMLAQSAAQNWFENPKNGWPPNAESTIKKKGSDVPLVDTNELRKSITYVLRDK
ncbi:hypothetical protein [Megamonas hypermegale]|uniref:hypothetical protein n=1 Tax=Megamonas hypermegale TaxID=158847 RepID=UPI0026F33919|nr:hypothetical protein [Megamonas hypermegale]